MSKETTKPEPGDMRAMAQWIGVDADDGQPIPATVQVAVQVLSVCGRAKETTAADANRVIQRFLADPGTIANLVVIARNIVSYEKDGREDRNWPYVKDITEVLRKLDDKDETK